MKINKVQKAKKILDAAYTAKKSQNIEKIRAAINEVKENKAILIHYWNCHDAVDCYHELINELEAVIDSLTVDPDEMDWLIQQHHDREKATELESRRQDVIDALYDASVSDVLEAFGTIFIRKYKNQSIH